MTRLGHKERIGWPRAIMGAYLVLWALARPGAWAQQLGDVGDISPERLLNDQLVVLAREALGDGQDLRPDQLTRTRVLLDMALRLRPADADAWRLRVELARHMGDRAGEMKAIKSYCSLRPEDDAAQLAWIMATIDEHQTVAARIALAENILQRNASQRLSEPLRSRLALFVARNALEIDDTARFTRWLKVAIDLDRSNQEAASLALDWLRSAGASAAQVGQALMHLVLADPVNPQPRLQLAQLLFSQGAYTAAALQYEAVSMLNEEANNEQMVYNWVHSVAASGRVDKALGLLAQYEGALRPPAATQPEDPSSGPSVSGSTTGLPLDLELLRLALLRQSDQHARARGSFKRIQNLLRDRAGQDDPQAEMDLMWLGLLMDQTVPDQQALDKLKSRQRVNDLFVARITGWSHLRAGRHQETRRALASVFDEDPFAAYGVAQTYDRQNDPDRLRQLQVVVAMAPDNLAGMMAACDLISAGTRPQPTSDGRVVMRLLDAWSNQLTSPNPVEDPWTTLSIHVEPTEFTYLQPITARLTLRNTTDFPLSLGPGQSVPSQLLLSLSVRQGGAAVGDLPPIVVDMQRKLTLPPRSTLEVKARLDRAVLGSVLSMTPMSTIGFHVNATLGPQFGPDGRMSPHLLGASESAYLIQRKGLPMTVQQVDLWIAMLGDTDPVRQMLGAALLVRTSTLLDDTESGQEFGEKISDAMGKQYGQLTPISQAWTARFLPPDEISQERFGSVHEAAQRSNNPRLRIIYAATQVQNPQSTVIDAMLRHDDPLIAAFGKALREGLAAEAQQESGQQEDDTSSVENVAKP